MNEARFIELLNAYGAELSRWPEDDRIAAEALLEVAPHRLKDIWESERSFDHLLALEKDGPATIALETKVLSFAPGRTRSGPQPTRSETITARPAHMTSLTTRPHASCPEGSTNRSQRS